MVNQIQKNAFDIDTRLKAIEHARLFKPPERKYGELPSCKVSQFIRQGQLISGSANLPKFRCQVYSLPSL